MSTQFQHKGIHKGSWTSPNFTTVNQIDHVLTNTNKKILVRDVRNLRGLNCDSDHFLVKTTIKQRLITKPRGNIVDRKKWNMDNTQNPIIVKQYRQKIYEKFQKQKKRVDKNQEWENIKSVIIESAEETIKPRERNICNKWWDEECKMVISRKNILRKKCLQKITRANHEQYKQARKEANKICKEKEKQWINSRIKQVEEAHKDIRAFQNDRSFPIFTCKDENGTLKTDKQEIMNRWKQYFAKLMETDKHIDNQAQEAHTIENDIEIELPTYKIVSDIIHKLKGNKAPGTDNIPAELIKYGGYILKQRMYNLILSIRNKEQLPMEWLQGIIYPIYKKGERTVY
jgi:hypothetical protein